MGLSDAAAYHGLAENKGVAPAHRLSLALKALEEYAAVVARVEKLAEHGPFLTRWVDGSKLIDVADLVLALQSSPSPSDRGRAEYGTVSTTGCAISGPTADSAEWTCIRHGVDVDVDVTTGEWVCPVGDGRRRTPLSVRIAAELGPTAAWNESGPIVRVGHQNEPKDE